MEGSLSQVAADSTLPDEDGNVMFVLDQTNRVRALPEDHLEDAHFLSREMSSFAANARNFGETVDSVIGVVTAEAKKIEEEQYKVLLILHIHHQGVPGVLEFHYDIQPKCTLLILLDECPSLYDNCKHHNA
ncbi:hypothetical protein TGDOM2_367020 [Toxoplasma gondii GAB2-2007-GAL-DOM2]|uniref:Uncharacterized protein n=3 Tax=Toxoplasma gondii TaxID=5811 RepID=S7UQC4_TOXGG|nr:hypothetical protein TGGT1_367020 [Toxoplasma gondii GT1]KFG42298.1 hypothetical protein TGDOM2_367020 [Toxoplasma gondii GAB2-2007-GAL-DOM2]RQX73634.1 hypothetical protein TGCAST_367020 [Toxoplasma gondii CAST]